MVLAFSASALLIALVTGVGPVSAAHAAGDDRSLIGVTDSYPARDSDRGSKPIQLAKETSSNKTVVKTKKDGTVVTKTTTKTNDGHGNKSTTRTTTTSSSSSSDSSGTSQPQSGGSGGASYEGE
jgi:hypothetical protein